MARRGYQGSYGSYRGRGPLGKILIAILLTLIIIFSVFFLFLQSNLVVGEDGVSRLQLPWMSSEVEENHDNVTSDQEVEQVVPDPEWEELRVYPVQAVPFTQDVYGGLTEQLELMPEYNAVAVTIKDTNGYVYFDAPSALNSARHPAEDTAAALSSLISSPQYTIARFACFHDPRGAKTATRSRALRTTTGYIFDDENRSQWMDPSKSGARDYLYALARETAELGFDEILLTSVCYPTTGEIDRIDYGNVSRGENLSTFLSELRAVLEPYNVTVSIEVPRAVLAGEEPAASGLSMDVIAPWVDRIYTSSEPDEIPYFNDIALQYKDGMLAFMPELTWLPESRPKRYVLTPNFAE